MNRCGWSLLLVAAMVMVPAAPGAAQEPSRDADAQRMELRDKTRQCAQSGETECARVCQRALGSLRGGGDGDAELVARCHALAAPGGAAPAAVPQRPQLIDDRWAWLPDVEGVVARTQGIRRGYRIVADDHSAWVELCGSHAQAMAGVTPEERGLLVEGVRVRLRYVQHDTTLTPERARAGKCAFGALEVVG